MVKKKKTDRRILCVWDRYEQLKVFRVRVQGTGRSLQTKLQRKKGLTRSRSSTAKTDCAKWADNKLGAKTFGG